MDKLISILIVTYNSEEFIEDCIQSVFKNIPRNSEILVLDNASTDETVLKLEKFKDQIRIIESNQNLGFAKANNQLAKQATGKYLFLLNPDTKLSSNIFEELINFYESNLDIAVIAPKLILPNNQIQKSVMKLPTIRGAISELLFKNEGNYLPYAPNDEKPLKVECVFGAAWLIKREIYQKLNGFDEKYFLYYEDIDMCKRIKNLGLDIYYYPKVSLEHIMGGSKAVGKYQENLESSRIFNGTFKNMIFKVIFFLHRMLRVR